MSEADLAPYRALKDRDLASEGLLIAEGPILVERLLASGCVVRSVVCLPHLAERFRSLAAGRCPVHVLDRARVRDLVGFPFHRGALACGARPPVADLERVLARSGEGLVVVCPDLSEDANVGLILRSALAFGAMAALLGPGSADPYGRRALRQSMGAPLYLSVARYVEPVAAVSSLRAAGYHIVGTANRPEGVPLETLRPPQRVAVLIGNEATGLDEGWLGACDVVARIPMDPRLDSLGASVAAGIVLYHFRKVPGGA